MVLERLVLNKRNKANIYELKAWVRCWFWELSLVNLIIDVLKSRGLELIIEKEPIVARSGFVSLSLGLMLTYTVKENPPTVIELKKLIESTLFSPQLPTKKAA